MNKTVRGSARRVLAIGISTTTTTGARLSPEEVLAPDGMLILMEGDPVRAERARHHFSSPGLEGRATVIAGDPRRMLHKLAGPFDVIFYSNAYSPVRDRLALLLAPDGELITDDRK